MQLKLIEVSNDNLVIGGQTVSDRRDYQDKEMLAYENKFWINNTSIIVPSYICYHHIIDHNLIIIIDSYCTPQEICKEHKKTYNRNRNIWCFNARGEKIWEIEDRLYSMDCEDKAHVDPYISIYKCQAEMPYTRVSDDEEGVWEVSTFGGFVGILDIETGKVSKWRCERW